MITLLRYVFCDFLSLYGRLYAFAYTYLLSRSCHIGAKYVILVVGAHLELIIFMFVLFTLYLDIIFSSFFPTGRN